MLCSRGVALLSPLWGPNLLVIAACHVTQRPERAMETLSCQARQSGAKWWSIITLDIIAPLECNALKDRHLREPKVDQRSGKSSP